MSIQSELDRVTGQADGQLRRGRAGCGPCVVGLFAVFAGVALLIVLVGAGWFLLRPEQQAVGPEIQMTPIVGGMVVPSTASATEPLETLLSTPVSKTPIQERVEGEPELGPAIGGSATDEAEARNQSEDVAEVEPTVTGVNTSTPSATLESSVPDGEDDRTSLFEPGVMVFGSVVEIVLYASPAENALLLDTYRKGSLFSVVEPSGDDPDYPVISDGREWVRVRADDGLVGWVEADMLLLVSE